MTEKPEGRLELIASKNFSSWEDLYKVVDFLNKSLKHKQLIIGLSKNKEDNTMTVNIYET
ncbi:hypothetical protein SY88_03120 [Clostridiales bacterium PH28_bin88]|nr:hypothetical protein SY88_03120 [Clostridiales bacterium PH28_bin88]